jgi:FSR family fosmidomycin resistance protein-like MFS transporter
VIHLLNSLFVSVVSLAHFSIEVADGGISLVLPLIKERLGISHTLIAIIMMVRIIGSSVFQPVFGVLVDLKPQGWLLPTSVLLTSAGVAALGYSPLYIAVLAAVFIGGLGAAAFHPAASKAVYLNSGIKKASGLALFMVCGNVGYALGPIVMSLLLIQGLQGTIYIMIPGIAATVVLLQSMKRPAVMVPEAPGTGRDLRLWVSEGLSKPVILLTSFSVMRSLVHLGFITYIPFYYPYEMTSWALALYLVAGALGTLVGGTLADRHGPKRVTILSSLLAAPMSIAFAATSGVWSFIFLALSGMTLVATASVTILLCQDLMPKSIGLASGLMMGFVYGVAGIALVPFGYLADLISVHATLWSLSLTTIPTLILAYLAVSTGAPGEPTGSTVKISR